MDTDKKLTLSISPEQMEKLLTFKREMFFDKPWSELYRTLLEKGTEVLGNELAKGGQ